MYDCFIKSYNKEGLGVFTRGFVVVSLRAFPINGIIFLGYEITLKLLNAKNNTITQ